MPFSPLDALMQISKPQRPVEPPARSDAPAFAPALEHAYQAETPRSAPTQQPATQAPRADAAVASDKRRDSDKPADDAVASPEDSEQVEQSQEQADQGSEETQEDAVEISAEAAAAAGIVQEAKNVEQQIIVNAGDDASAAETVKAIDSKSADATQQQSETDAAAKSAHEFDATDQEFQADSSNDESAEPIISGLHSSPRRHATSVGKNQVTVGSNADATDAYTAKNPEETEIAFKTGAEQATLEQVDSSKEGKSESRKQADAEKATNNDDIKPAASQVDLPVATDATAAASTNAAENVELAAADVSSVAPVAAATDAAPSSTDGSQRSTSALDRLMAGRSLKSSKETGESDGMPTVDRARFVQRVEGAMKAAQLRDGKIQVRLSPPDLGSVKIELAVQNGVLSAKLEAETPAARNLLLDSLPALRERLAQQDIRVEKFDVDVRDQGSNAGSGQADDRTADQSNERQNGRSRPATERTAIAPTAPARSLAAVSSAAAGLDVRV